MCDASAGVGVRPAEVRLRTTTQGSFPFEP